MFAINKKETLDIILEESLKKFSKIKPSDRVLYGKNYGNNELLAFAKYIDPNFVTPRHIKLIADKLEAVEKGKIKRLIISIPPRFGKSYLASQMFLAWLMGRNPRREIILASYNDSKAEEYTRWVRDTCNYDLFRNVFPQFSMNEKKQAAGEWYTSAGGKVLAAGIKGGVTGYGAHFMIIDDPVKDFEQATSDLIQEKIWNRYRADIRTRLYPGAVIIVIMTRWTSNDLAGRLILNEGLLSEGGKWDVLSLPVLDLNGKSLWPEAYGLDEIQDIRESVGEKIFQALYQQTPVDMIDHIFSDPVFREPPSGLPVIGYLDPAFGGNDFSALTTGGLEVGNDKESKAYITGGWVWKSQIDKSYDTIEKIYKQEKLRKLWIESNQAQRIMKYELEKRNMNIGLIDSVRDKHFRIINYAKQNWGKLYFSRNVTPEYMKQLLGYNELSKDKDAADSLAGLIQQLGIGRSKISERYSGLANLFRGMIR
ncbi:MAG: terminase family protein [Leptospirales bacterium]|nr:terminase family protein [Leptospirales bacterium]